MWDMSSYYEFQKRVLTCKHCGWQGKGADCDVYEMHEGGGMTDYACPKCKERIGAAPWPTIEE